MNFYSIFYWITIADSVKQFFDSSSNIFTWLTVLSFIAYIICSFVKAVESADNKVKNEEEEKVNPDVRSIEIVRKLFAKLSYTFLPLALITWACYIFTPTKKDCLLIVAGGAVGNFITTDTSAKSIPSDITKFLHLSLNKEIDDLSKEVKTDIRKELGIESKKDKLIEIAKKLTKDEFIEYLKTDTLFDSATITK